MRRLPGELSLSDWLNHAGLTLILGDDRVIEGDQTRARASAG
jgi:hypothetical protein